MSSPDPNLMAAVRCLREAQILTCEAQALVRHADSLSEIEKEQMAHSACQNQFHLRLTATFGETRMLREVEE